MNEEQLKIIDKRTIETVKKYLQSNAFTLHKITDNPNDALQVTPRKYITRYSTTALRPTSSVLGEFYFDTTAGVTATWNGTFYQDPSGGVVS